MMASLADWIKVLIVVVLLGNLVDFVLPKGDLKRYGGLVVGLVILATVVSPLWSWLHQTGKQGPIVQAGWTNSPTGFNQVVQTEEIHQAESIVLSMPGVIQCQMSRQDDGRIIAQVQATNGPSRERLTHYVRSALKVTMGGTSRVEVNITRVSPARQTG